MSSSTLYVMRITNKINHKYTFVCAAAFTAPERTMFVPKWALDLTGTADGERMYIDAIGVPVITDVTIKAPKGFSQLKNPLPLIEFALKNHSILFVGKKVTVDIFDQKYQLEIQYMKPANIGNITNTDAHLAIVFDAN